MNSIKTGTLLATLLMLFALTLTAQTAKELISENPLRAAGSLHRYEPLDTNYTTPPAGYKPFYISHFGRHGSRYHSSESAFSAIHKLQDYKNKGLLTVKGESVLQDLQSIFEATDGRYGALTGRGAQEQHDIAARMQRHYPEVFSSTERNSVIAIATVSQRVIDSRDAFLSYLLKNAPALTVERYTERDKKQFEGAHQEVRGHSPTEEEKAFLKTVSVKEAKKRWSDSLDCSRLLKEWFTNPSGVSKTIVSSVYNSGRIRQGMDEDNLPWIEKYYLPSELFYIWCDNDISWFNSSCISADNHGIIARRSGAGILEMIVRDAESAIKKGGVAAHFRFSHDLKLLPLLAAIGVEGVDFRGDPALAPEKMFNFQNICTGGNLQLVFFRNDGGDILVKLLKNEKEVMIPALHTPSAPFYGWKELRAYFASIISALEDHPSAAL